MADREKNSTNAPTAWTSESFLGMTMKDKNAPPKNPHPFGMAPVRKNQGEILSKKFVSRATLQSEDGVFFKTERENKTDADEGGEGNAKPHPDLAKLDSRGTGASLFDQLKAQRDEKDEEDREKRALALLPKALDDEDAAHFDAIEERAQRRRREEAEKERRDRASFKVAVAVAAARSGGGGSTTSSSKNGRGDDDDDDDGNATAIGRRRRKRKEVKIQVKVKIRAKKRKGNEDGAAVVAAAAEKKNDVAAEVPRSAGLVGGYTSSSGGSSGSDEE